MIRILVVEDEPAISDMLRMALLKAGYEVQCVFDGISAADILETTYFDLILLDVMLPGVDGFSLMEFVHSIHIPVIFLTAKDSVEDRVKGLRMGAEDYVVKPFSVLELLARIEVILRRYDKSGDKLIFDDLTIDTRAMVVRKGNKTIPLTAKEYALLLLFVRNPGIVLGRQMLYEQVWGGNYPEGTRTLDLHIQRMRRKVGWQGRLISVPKYGYRLEE